MDLRFEHRIARPLADVERTLLAPDFAERLARESELLANGEEIDREERERAVVRTAHFIVRGAIPLLGRFGTVGWREVVTWDRSYHRGTFEVVPDLPSRLRSRVRCRGSYELSPVDGGTLRVLQASVDLDVPLAKASVEARIASLLDELFSEEARVLGQPR